VAAQVTVSARRILVLLALVAALSVYLFVYEVPQARKEGHREKLLPLDKDAVTGVSLVYPDREIDVRKDGGNWRVVKPIDAPADESVVKSVVSTIADAEVQKTLDEMPQDLGGFGLDKPSVTVRVTLKDGSQPPPLAVGKNTAIGGKTYVRKGDEPKLYLTTSSLQFGLNKQVKDLRDKQLIAFQDDDVSRVDIAPAGAETVTLLRKDKEAWTVDPGGHAADVTEVRSYLSSLRSTRATDFPDDAPADLAKYGLDHPRLTVTVATGKEGGETKTLLLGNESTQDTQKQVYAKRADQPTVYALGDWSFRTLSKTAAQFRDKTVLGFDPSRVGQLRLERKDGAGVTLARADGGWRLEKGEGKAPKGEAIDRFLDDLRDLRGSDIAAEPAHDVAPYGLDAPDLRITLTDKEGQAMGTVLAAKHDGKYYVMHAGAETVFEARDYMYTRLDKQPRDLVESDAGPTATTQPPPPPAEEDEEDEQDEEPAPDEDAE
jgi:hypothetical protein